MGPLTVSWLVLVSAATCHGGGGWLDGVLENAGVKSEDVKVYTDKLNGAIKDVHGAISNVVDKVDWNKLYELATQKIKPKLKEGLPEKQCTRGLRIETTTSEVILEEGNIKDMKNIKSMSVKILGETDTEQNVLIRVEYAQLPYEFLFTYKNILLDVYDMKKNGRLQLLQKEPLYVNITGSVPKINSVLSQMMRKGTCVIKVQSIEAVIEGNLTFEKIKYRHSDLAFTKSTVSGIMLRAKKQVFEYMAEGMKYAIEAEIRKINLFCSPETPLVPIACKEVTLVKLGL